ncbi:MAG: methyl-accepting chemotaxis protein [Hasllibacter sp.]
MDAEEHDLIRVVGTIVDGPRALPVVALGAALNVALGADADLPAPGDLPGPSSWPEDEPPDPWLAALWVAEHAAPAVLCRFTGVEGLSELSERAGAMRDAVAAALAARDDAAELARLAREGIVPAVAAYVATVRAIHAEASVRDARSRARRTQRGLHEVGRIGRQIHMISVNASIEAARAGPAGRGFAVIGDEIRDLAAESAKVLRRLQEQLAGGGAVEAPSAPAPAAAPALPPPSPAAAA